MNKIITLIFIITLPISALCQQDFQLDLAGFMLGQFRECPKNEFGDPLVSEKYDDGFEYEIFLLRPDTSLYMIFEYSRSNLNSIWSIQITGKNHNPDFLNLNLGMTKNNLLSSFTVNPLSQQDIGEYGTKIIYDSTNYSFEVNTKDVLSSIKLIDESYKYYDGPNKIDRIPSFNEIKEILNSNNNQTIRSILAPDVEIYFKDSTYRFLRSLKSEIENDYSGVFNLIKSSANSISEIVQGDTTAYEENVRLALGHNPMHVIKFGDKYQIGELVFKYQFDKYFLWECDIRDK